MELPLLIKQDLKNAITNPVTILFCLIYPFTLIFLFGFLFSNQYTGDILRAISELWCYNVILFITGISNNCIYCINGRKNKKSKLKGSIFSHTKIQNLLI